MDIIKISILGLTAVLLAMLVKSYRQEYSYYISLAAGICIFLYVAAKLQFILTYIKKMEELIPLQNTCATVLFKMIGVTYVAEFSSGLCKDAGYQTIAGQIELFARLSILVLSMPVLFAFMETIGELL